MNFTISALLVVGVVGIGITALVMCNLDGRMSKGLTFLYFAYGSNLYSKRIQLSNPSAVFKSVAKLKDYQLEFPLPSKRWMGAAANIRKQNGSHVYGVLWKLDLDNLDSLDRQEGVHQRVYERFEAEVEADNESLVSCQVYRLTPETRENGIKELGENQKPSIAYKNVMLRGAKENKLPEDYINFLKNVVDNGKNGEIDLDILLKSLQD